MVGEYDLYLRRSPGVSCTHSGEKCGGRGTAGEEAGIFPNALELADGRMKMTEEHFYVRSIKEGENNGERYKTAKIFVRGRDCQPEKVGRIHCRRTGDGQWKKSQNR